jgi:hypothetical protein
MRHPNGTPLWIIIGVIPPVYFADTLQKHGIDGFGLTLIAGIWAFTIGYIFARNTSHRDPVIGQEIRKGKRE